MTDTANLGLPFIEGSQAQKHVTHNEALRILDAAIHIGVLDTTRVSPPATPVEGERHVVAAGATGAWVGQTNTIATYEDGGWRFLTPKLGWCVWSAADNVLFVFDGTDWRNLHTLPTTLDNAAHVGINATASSPNLLTVRSNAALFNSVNTGDGGTGDTRIQISKENDTKTASVVFSDAFSGRAEFGLIGSDAFKLKVSPDGSAFVDAFSIDQTSGNLTLPRGLTLTGTISPPQITSNQNDYAPAGFAAASVVRISSDAIRNITGFAGGSDGRLIYIFNAGSFSVVLQDENALSAAVNRFGFGASLTLASKQSATLIYDLTASRWRLVGGASGIGDVAGPSSAIADNIVTFNGATGKIIKDSGVKIPVVTGSAPSFATRAWVNFNGVTTVSIRGSGNVSSVTRTGVGDYTVNFFIPMPDAAYAVSIAVSRVSGSNTNLIPATRIDNINAPTLSSFRFQVGIPDTSRIFQLTDAEHISITVIR